MIVIIDHSFTGMVSGLSKENLSSFSPIDFLKSRRIWRMPTHLLGLWQAPLLSKFACLGSQLTYERVDAKSTVGHKILLNHSWSLAP